MTEERVGELLRSAKSKMYAVRLKRPTPYVDKTIYAGWNAMCVSAYLEAAKALGLADARRFALRSLDRLLGEGWSGGESESAAGSKRPALRHVIAYSDPKSERRETAGVLDDYAFTVIACLDAYEATADLTYYRFARTVAEAMIEGFHDRESGGFFDTRRPEMGSSAAGLTGDQPDALQGILGTPRKPFQDSPTPGGNPAAAIALLRLYGYTNDSSYRDVAANTLALYAGSAGQHGIFAATYGLAVARFLQPHAQIVVVGRDAASDELFRQAAVHSGMNTAVIRLDPGQATAENLPPALAETIPSLPALSQGKSFAVVCSGFTCRPPVFNSGDLVRTLELQDHPAA
jgi:hypothetical protein